MGTVLIWHVFFRGTARAGFRKGWPWDKSKRVSSRHAPKKALFWMCWRCSYMEWKLIKGGRDFMFHLYFQSCWTHWVSSFLWGVTFHGMGLCY